MVSSPFAWGALARTTPSRSLALESYMLWYLRKHLPSRRFRNTIRRTTAGSSSAVNEHVRNFCAGVDWHH
eukprot:1316928-Amorphochlora_amoeboformis.AAC.2